VGENGACLLVLRLFWGFVMVIGTVDGLDGIITATLTPLVGRQGLVPLTLVAARCRVGED
jgi:hypothetical protein